MNTPQVKPLPLFITQKTTCWSERKQYFVALTLEESVRDTIDGWGFLDYVVSKEVFDDDPVGVVKLMKLLGYRNNGNYTFQHYSNKRSA